MGLRPLNAFGNNRKTLQFSQSIFILSEGDELVCMKKQKTIRYIELAALKGLLRERKTSYGKMAKVIGVSVNAFSNRINGHCSFDVIEMEKIAEYFNIDVLDIGRYFFPNKQSSSKVDSLIA
jgi:transcriptional regulator with XRE-family HTH domain